MRPRKRWLILVPEGDDVQLARSPFDDQQLIVSDYNVIRTSIAAAQPRHASGVLSVAHPPVELLGEHAL